MSDSGEISLSWQDPQGHFRFSQGRCLEISQTGMRVQIPERVAVRSYVSLKAECAGLACSASVRHCMRKAGRFVVGLEFSSPLPLAHPALTLTSHRQSDTSGGV
jgi:hypothetical protein